jgi:hypothetical protein
MKRSEAIEIIFNRLGPIGISESTCEEVLSLLESKGMIPPSIYIKLFDKYDNVWEPENA